MQILPLLAVLCLTAVSTMKYKRAVRSVISLAFWLGVWQLAAICVGKELILPTPLAVVKVLIKLCASGSFWLSAGLSLARVFCGFFAGVIIGSLLAWLTYVSPVSDTLFSPIIRIVRATPVASFIILALLWIGKALVPAFISMLMVIPIIWGSTRTAIDQTDKNLLEMGNVYRLGFRKTLRYIYIPSVFPAWRSACITALGLSWKAGIAAEVLCVPRLSIGSNLYNSKIYLETPSLFAWTCVVILLSFFVEKGLVQLLKHSPTLIKGGAYS